MTTTLIQATPVPVKTSDMSWDAFTEAIKSACDAEDARLLAEFPTPPITAERGSDGWMDQWAAQHAAGSKRRSALMNFSAKLVVAVGQALADCVPNFRSLDVDYEGSGDSGEACDISVYLNLEPLLDADGKWRRPTPEEDEARNRQRDEANNTLPAELTEWLDETCWAIAYDRHPGFEIDEGGYGQISVAPADEDDPTSPLQLTITHTERTETTYDEEVLA